MRRQWGTSLSAAAVTVVEGSGRPRSASSPLPSSSSSARAARGHSSGNATRRSRRRRRHRPSGLHWWGVLCCRRCCRHRRGYARPAITAPVVIVDVVEVKSFRVPTLRDLARHAVFQMSYARKAGEDERMSWRTVIHLNLVCSINTTLDALEHAPETAVWVNLLWTRLSPLRRVQRDLETHLGLAQGEEVHAASEAGTLRRRAEVCVRSLVAGLPRSAVRRARGGARPQTRRWRSSSCPVMTLPCYGEIMVSALRWKCVMCAPRISLDCERPLYLRCGVIPWRRCSGVCPHLYLYPPSRRCTGVHAAWDRVGRVPVVDVDRRYIERHQRGAYSCRTCQSQKWTVTSLHTVLLQVLLHQC